MARDYARIMTAIWRNKEFRGLDEAPQRMYLFLVTQPDISAAGVLPLRVRRWSESAGDSTPDGLRRALKVLEAGRFIAVDWDVEELLIRSFIRWDGGFNNPKRRPVIVREAREVDSAVILRHLAAEFERCGLPGLDGPPDGPPPSNGDRVDSHADSLSDAPSKIEKVDPGAEPFPQVNSLSDRAPTNPGVVGTYVSTENTATHNPQPPVPPSAADGFTLALVDPGPAATAGDVVAAWAEGFATTGNRPVKRLRGQVASEAKALLEAGNDPDRVIAAARVLGAKGRATLVTELAIQSTGDRRPGATPPLPSNPATALADIRRRADAQAASRLLEIPYLPTPQRPSDDTPTRVYDRDQALRFIDTHADALRTALAERKPA